MSPFHKIPYLPEFDRMTPANAGEAFIGLLAEAHAAVDRLEQESQPTWSGLVRPLHDACYPLLEAWGLLSHMLSVMNSPEWRQIQEELQPEIVRFSLRVNQSRTFYEGYLAIRQADETKPSLTPVRRRILARTIRNVEQAGVGLPPEQRERFNAILTELARLATEFNNNTLDATKAFALTMTEAREVEGLPESLLAVAAQAAREAGATGASATQGPWRITLDHAVYIPFMTHSHNRAAREQLYRASVTRASAAPLDNSPLIERMLELRREMAAMLGYGNYAELSLAGKTARHLQAVDDLTEQLAAASQAPASAEADALLAFARAQGFDESRLQPWDTAFWAERQREQLYGYNEEALSRYFPFPRVLEGLFRLAGRLFGIVVTPADGEAPLWHPDVRFYRVSDRKGAPLAYFYLDPYTRPATKSGGAWMNDFRSRDLHPDGSLTLPLAVMVCNQSVPVGDAPSLMRFNEVTTLFHEFGHALQHMLTTVDDPEASGINGVEWDAVEIASQFMENWCYDRDTLRGLSRHIDTGETLPDELFDKLVAARNYRAASAMRRQLFLGAIDMDLHARYTGAPAAGQDSSFASAEAVKLHNAAKFLTQPLLPEDRFLNTFSHIFGGGYAAGYYSYKWSEVLSADIFAAFEEAGLDDEDAVRRSGLLLRDTLLALGGGTDPMEVFRLFRGRPPKVDALLRHCGLAHAEPPPGIPHPQK